MAALVHVVTPEALLGRLLYRDGLMLIVDKPAGLPVHAGPGGGANLEALFDALRFGLPHPPALAHRLDRDTSGCLVLGRHRKALARLGKLFATGHVEKTYWAIVEGAPPECQGRVELPLKKRTPKSGWHMAVDKEGQRAITDYRLLGSSADISWLEFKPRTGRTHQIRVHAAALGCPIVGDRVYGKGGRYRSEEAKPGNDREPSPPAAKVPLHLHARAISVPLYYPKKPPVVAEAPPPPHMIEALTACGYTAESGKPIPGRAATA